MDPLDSIKEQLKAENMSGQSKDGFAVPDGYFDQLENAIISKTVDATSHDLQVVNKTRNLWKYSAMAASVCLLIAAIFVFNDTASQIDNSAVAELNINDISQDESIDYLINEDISTEDILELSDIDEILKELQEEIITDK